MHNNYQANTKYLQGSPVQSTLEAALKDVSAPGQNPGANGQITELTSESLSLAFNASRWQSSAQQW